MNGTSEAAAMLNILREMMQEERRETRKLVMEILQGREPVILNGDSTLPPPADQERAERLRFDPPDYDDPSNDPEWMVAVGEREDRETSEMRQLQTEQALLNGQLRDLRERAGLDSQGPSSEPSFSKESIGLRWPSEPPKE
jgi:hypothetical protein